MSQTVSLVICWLACCTGKNILRSDEANMNFATWTRMLVREMMDSTATGTGQQPLNKGTIAKLTAVTFNTKHSGLPAYLHDDLHEYQPTRMLQSSTSHLIHQSLVLTSVASSAFTVAAPNVQRSLSVNTQSADNFASFKCRLKSELFTSSYAT